ncbi:hypothetical protein P7C71_g321, partial [Lecanoromycetidae sp. Uapishka_2]
MTVINIAILATLLPAILAFPQHGGWGAHMGHGPVKGKLPSGFPTGFPHPSGVPGGPHHHRPHPSGAPPFPAPGNTTSGGATGSGTGSLISTGVSPFLSNSPETGAPGPVTIQSTLYVVPQPVTTLVGGGSAAASSTGSLGQSPASGLPGGSGGASPSSAAGSGSSPSEAPGSGSSPSSAGSGSSPSSAPGSGSGSGAESGVCGPATVTITVANTVTVTVPASPASGAPESGSPESQAPISSQPAESQAPIPSQPALPSVAPAPFPMSNSSIPVGPTATGTAVASASSLPVYSAPIVPPISPVVPVVSTSAAPVIAPVVSTSATPSQVNTVLEATNGQAYVPTSAPAPAEAATQAVEASSVPVQAMWANHNSVAPIVSSSPVATSATPSVTSSPSSGGKRGLLYGSLPAAQAFDMTKIGWCGDWDSSKTPGSGWATGELNCQFIPQLLSDAGGEDGHTMYWPTNSAGYAEAAAFNEPDQCGGGGTCMPVGQAITSWGTYMQDMDALLISPATTNDLTTPDKGLDYMRQFLLGCQGCKIHALAFHVYMNAWDINETPGSLEATIQAYQKLQLQYNIPKLYISEMATNQAPTQDQMDAILSYLDGNSAVDRYAWNGLDSGTGQQLSGMLEDCYTS